MRSFDLGHSISASLEPRHNPETNSKSLNATVAGWPDSRSACFHRQALRLNLKNSGLQKIQCGTPRRLNVSRAPFSCPLMHALIATRRKKNCARRFFDVQPVNSVHNKSVAAKTSDSASADHDNFTTARQVSHPRKRCENFRWLRTGELEHLPPEAATLRLPLRCAVMRQRPVFGTFSARRGSRSVTRLMASIRCPRLVMSRPSAH